MMEKNGNTIFPGDKVIKVGKPGDKTAGASGTVKGIANTDFGGGFLAFEVEWADGHSEWLKPEEIEKK